MQGPEFEPKIRRFSTLKICESSATRFFRNKESSGVVLLDSYALA